MCSCEWTSIRFFAQHGARVAVHGRDETGVASVCADITRAAGTAHLVVADVTRWSEIEAMRSDIERTLGPIEILVANAGGSLTASGPLEEMSEDGRRASVEAFCLV